MPAKSFFRDRRGNVAILFGLALVPIVGLAGTALDYSRANGARAQLQAALDATALAVAREPRTLSDAEINARAQAFFEANFPNLAPFAAEPVRVVRTEQAISVESRARVPTSLAAALGYEHIDVGADARVGWSMGRIELALVLDNTGSMGWSGKMQEMKSAAEDLLTILEDAADQPDSVRVALIPFDSQVRLTADPDQAEWLYFPDGEGDGSGDGGRRGGPPPHAGGPNGGPPPHAGGPGGPNSGGGGGSSGEDVKARWQGCIADRAQPVDVDFAPAVDWPDEHRYPGVDCRNASLAPMLALTSDFRALRSGIAAMQPAGTTNVTIGVAWGLAAMEPAAPLPFAPINDKRDVRRFMIVLTDGDNTENAWTRDQAAIDDRTRLACEAVKAQDIALYTVRVIEGNETLLRNCASQPSMYYSVQNARDIGEAFRGIADEIASLRLTH